MVKKAVILAIVLLLGIGLYLLGSRLVHREAPSTSNGASNLDSLGYLSSVEDTDPREGVVLVDQKRVQPGLTVMTSASRETTCLVDTDGTIVHEWHTGPGTYAALDQQGYLFALRGDLEKLDWESEPIWSWKGSVHHDVWLGDEIVVLDRKPAMVEGPDGPVPIYADAIQMLDLQGRPGWRIPVWGFAGERVPHERFAAIHAQIEAAKTKDPGISELDVVQHGTPTDVFHTNSVWRINRTLNGIARPGDLLVSVRELHLVAIIRPRIPPEVHPEQEIGADIVWEYQGELQFQHHATLLENDHILVFDNGRKRGFSRVVEIDPATQEIVWEFSGAPEHSLYSGKRGSAQRLPNGNTLIAEADRGRVIEVTPDKEIVWEYLMHKQDDAHREPVYRAIRTTGELAETLREKARGQSH